jgi:hypothetical protein
VTKSGTAIAQRSSQAVLGSYSYLVGIFESDPNTGAAWTVSGVNATEFGIEIAS